MEHLLRLKIGLESLSKQELMEIINSLPENFLIDLLFKYFHSKMQDIPSTSALNNMIKREIQPFNTKITCLVQARKLQSNHIEKEVKPTRIDELPVVMVSNIASFMQFKDLLSFEKMNKYIFIATRSPISLQELPSTYSTKLIKYLNDNPEPVTNNYFLLNRFKSIKKYHLDISDHCSKNQHTGTLTYDRKLKNTPFWNELKALTILISTTNISDFQMAGTNVNVIEFSHDLSLLISTNTSIETIKIIEYIPEQCDDCDECDHIVDQITSLQFVDSLLYSTIKSSVQKRRAISVDYVSHDLSRHIYWSDINIPHRNQIESLHLDTNNPSLSRDLAIASVKHLQELCLTELDETALFFWSKLKLDTLQRINININYGDTQYFQESNCKLLESLFSASTLQYISIKMEDNMDRMIKFINNVLKMKPRKSMKIRLDYSVCCFDSDIGKIKSEMMDLLKTLKSMTSDFQVIGHFCFDVLDGINFDLQNEYLCNVGTAIDGHKTFKFVVSNKGCKISGYQEKWLIQCPRCKQHHQ